jgi:hypothetical protein
MSNPTTYVGGPGATTTLHGLSANERGAGSTTRRLGRLPNRAGRKALFVRDFVSFPSPPARTHFWTRRAPFEFRSFGNTSYGSCTRSKQANAARRMERIETRHTPEITDEEVIARYVEMSARRYGGGDNGAFEVDALDDWRNPETTIHDVHGRALTIDAYLRLNPFDHHELQGAMAAAGAHGIAICLALPWAFQQQNGERWEIPAGQVLTGDWMPGSWGGHSMWAIEYDATGLLLEHTWNRAPQWLSWDAASAYMDEAHLVIDSLDYWRAAKMLPARTLRKIRDAVNDVSTIPIK